MLSCKTISMFKQIDSDEGFFFVYIFLKLMCGCFFFLGLFVVFFF